MVPKYSGWTVWARDGAAGLPSRGWSAAPYLTWTEQGSVALGLPSASPEGAESGGASELAQDVCDTVRTDRDGGYPCL
jgi:hypothetical protein